jgi:branched-chain amino acid transport system substrate-binding protein
MPSFGITISPIMFTPYKRYVFAPPGDYWDFAGVAYDYIVNKMEVKDPKIAIARPDTEGGKVFAAGAKKWAGFFNQKYYEEIVAVGAIDVTSQVLCLKANGINNVLVGALPTPEVALVLSTGRRFQYFPNVWGIHYGCGEDAIERAGATAGNYYGLHAFSQWYDDTPEMKKVRETFLRYRPKSKPPVNYYQMGWYWGVIISEGLKRAGKEVDGEKLVDALETLRDFDTGGICGPVSYTPKSHKATNYCRIFKTDVKKKVLVPLSDWIKPAE